MSSATDPYYVAKDDVESAIKQVQKMHKEWKRLLQSENTARSKPFQDMHVEIQSELKTLDVDLQDITATINMVEENRGRFQFDDAEIASRKEFVRKSRGQVRDVQEDIIGRATTSKMEADKRQLITTKQSDNRSSEESRKAVQRDNQAFLDQQRQEQTQIIRQQDDALDELGASAKRLQQVATTINVELQDQQKMLNELDEDIEKEQEKLNFVMKRIGKLMKTSDNKQICLIIALSLLGIVLLFLVINT